MSFLVQLHLMNLTVLDWQLVYINFHAIKILLRFSFPLHFLPRVNCFMQCGFRDVQHFLLSLCEVEMMRQVKNMYAAE